MMVGGRWRRTIESYEAPHNPLRFSVSVLDQRALPHAVAWQGLSTIEDAVVAIRDMTVRGAPLIGATAAWGLAIAIGNGMDLESARSKLAATRPTAVNLAWALAEVKRAVGDTYGPERLARARAAAARICDEDVARNQAIGDHGLPLIRAFADRKRPVNILTHCNAGWLATVDWGTALAPIYRAHEEGIAVHVWVDETRPRNQGLLTAWELEQQGVPFTVIADNAGGHLMQQGKVDLCIVGTDRTTRNGDVCNKIGTYLKALAAFDNRVPFYVAAPTPSIDLAMATGAEVPIEERSGDEVRRLTTGVDLSVGVELTRVAIVADSTPVANPAFDVTPARLVTGIITERGIATPSELASFLLT